MISQDVALFTVGERVRESVLDGQLIILQCSEIAAKQLMRP